MGLSPSYIPISAPEKRRLWDRESMVEGIGEQSMASLLYFNLTLYTWLFCLACGLSGGKLMQA